jgi:hypothetical protein
LSGEEVHVNKIRYIAGAEGVGGLVQRSAYEHAIKLKGG